MCHLLNPFTCHPPFLNCSPSLVLSNYHLKCFVVSQGSYCQGVECGRTVSPFSHAHSTSRLTLTQAGKPLRPSLQSHHDYRGTLPLAISPHSSLRVGTFCLPMHRWALWISHPHAGGGSFSSHTDWDSHYLSHVAGRRVVFGCHSHFLLRGIQCVFHPNFGVYV